MKDQVAPQRTSHPRRPPAHHSVSLRHSPTAASDKANPPSSISPNNSGESSDAGKWFESSNQNARQSNVSFADNDPPFFLRNSSSGDTPPNGYGAYNAVYQPQPSLSCRPGLNHLGTDGSSTEDFRGVIDDLTVANRKLKQKLRTYEKLYDTHLQEEKLFEVRFHGLPGHKKKELEETLRKFAAGLGDSSSSDSPFYPPLSHEHPTFGRQKTASSHASRFAESGYASMPVSAHNSISAPSNQASNQANSGDVDRSRMTKSQYNRQQQNVQSYLHDIPVGLLPKNYTPMSATSRKKLVVRRLEQIFAGKRSTPGNHTQPMQQEEVAQSAAMADRQAKEATGQYHNSEGHREARIMSARADDEDLNTPVNSESLQKLRPNLNVNEQDFAGSGSPDQRPTRPLDLDLFRAQVPVENMEYIRHLGFTPPHIDSGEAPKLGHGWLYLNLLINMAQLHTFSVTPDFVKEAVTEYSSKFELSQDGRKIRWKGGVEGSKVSSGSSSEHFSGDSPYGSTAAGNGATPFRDLQIEKSGSGEASLDPERSARRLARAQKQKEQDESSYIPLFFHREKSEEDDCYGYEMCSSNTSPFPPNLPGDSSGFDNSVMQNFSSKKRRNNGPMIFYKQVKFCTDLSGDFDAFPNHDPNTYNCMTTHPLGIPPVSSSSPQQYDTGVRELRRAFDSTATDIDFEDGSRTCSSIGDMGFSPEALRNDNGTDNFDPIEFEASGLGGVQPDDNFYITVRRSQIQSMTSSNSVAGRKSQLYRPEIREILHEHATQNRRGAESNQQHVVIKEEILSATRKSLPSSSLPPASFMAFGSLSSGDVDSDIDSDVSSNPSSTSSSGHGHMIDHPGSTMSPVRAGTRNQDSEDEYSEEDSDSDGSIDLLATARQTDPTFIRASEREYDAAIAERLAEVIPAGSSAATAGGGSGFNTPSDPHVAISSKPARTTRRSTSGSMSSRLGKRSRELEVLGTDLEGSKRRKSQKTE
jgi:hypothetical protein